MALVPEQLDGLVGEYEAVNPGAKDGGLIPVLVTREGGRLFLEVKPFISRQEILPASADSFFMLAGGDLGFTRDGSGRGVKVGFFGITAVRKDGKAARTGRR
jgi:hypothetical protein